MEYLFESEQFALSKDGWHLLRSRYNYKTYQFNEIHEVVITKGRLVNNWLIILLLGIGMIAFSIFYTIGLYGFLTDGSGGSIYIEEIVVPVIPLLLGLYCLYASLRLGPVAKVRFEKSKKAFPLDKIKKQNELNDFIDVLRSSDLSDKFKLDYK